MLYRDYLMEKENMLGGRRIHFVRLIFTCERMLNFWQLPSVENGFFRWFHQFA